MNEVPVKSLWIELVQGKTEHGRPIIGKVWEFKPFETESDCEERNIYRFDYSRKRKDRNERNT